MTFDFQKVQWAAPENSDGHEQAKILRWNSKFQICESRRMLSDSVYMTSTFMGVTQKIHQESLLNLIFVSRPHQSIKDSMSKEIRLVLLQGGAVT